MTDSRTRLTSRVILLVLALLCSTGTTHATTAPFDHLSSDPVVAWNVAAHDAAVVQDDYLNGLAVVRALAMMHLAQHDALNAIEPFFESYVFRGSDAAADPLAAASSAAHGILSAIFPDQRDSFDELLARMLDRSAGGVESRQRGIALGARAAGAVLLARENDGSDTAIMGGYTPQEGPARYQYHPPYDFAFLPGWRHMKPFALLSPDQFRPPPPPALRSEEYARDFEEVKALGGAVSSRRTENQLAYALFWEEYSDMGWNRIARVVAAERGIGMQSAARLFALLNMAMSDSYVAGWDGKYHYDFWRPVTAIRAADTDGNPATMPDRMWESVLETPPVQDYPSTHSALGNAAAAVLASVFGDATAFTFSSTTADPTHPARSFSSFSQAADENADSRVIGGLHFRFACDAGQELGRRIAQWVLDHHLRQQQTASN